MSLPLELNCLDLGNDPNLVFQVEIAGAKSVGTLREFIKDKKKFVFDQAVRTELRAQGADMLSIQTPIVSRSR